MAKHPRGIRRWKGGWQAYVRTKDGLKSKSFPKDHELEKMKAWRLSVKLEHPKTTTGPAFQKDVTAYLERVTAMPTYGQRKQHLDLWLEALGADRPRATITASEIDRVLQRWLMTCQPDTVRKRRTSLLALYHKLDGKAASNPVRETIPPKPKAPKVRGLDLPTLERVLASLPARNAKHRTLTPSKTAARLRVMAWTGLPPGMLMKVTPADVDLTKAELRVVSRTKGAGSPARVVPLTPQAVDAFTGFIAAEAFGPFAIAAAGRVLHRACKRVGEAPIRLYDLRHSFGALLYRTTRDLPTVARFLLHKSLSSTARYAYAAVGDVDRAAAASVGQLRDNKTAGSGALARTSTPHARRRRGRRSSQRKPKKTAGNRRI